jgi:ABC-2 type transport system permease protein
MNTTLADTAEGGPSDAACAAKRPGDILLTLVRREFWEHRALWLAPLVVTALLALAAAIGRMHANVDVDDAALFQGEAQRVALFTLILAVVAMPLYVVVMFVVAFYLLDCLYAERKDRSILFWKSLPVSDGLTVSAKMLVALVVVPLGAFVLALLAGLLFMAILGARVLVGSLPPLFAWNTYEWFRTELVMLLVTAVAVLWFAPLAGYLLLVSAWVRRSPILLATLPAVLGPILEWVAFGTRYLMDFINYRLNGIWWLLGVHNTHLVNEHGEHLVGLRPVGTALETLNFRAVLTSVDLWLGLAVAGALVYAAVRIRRYRDDS